MSNRSKENTLFGSKERAEPIKHGEVRHLPAFVVLEMGWIDKKLSPLDLITAAPNLCLAGHPPINERESSKACPPRRQVVFGHRLKIEKRAVRTDKSVKIRNALLLQGLLQQEIRSLS